MHNANTETVHKCRRGSLVWSAQAWSDFSELDGSRPSGNGERIRQWPDLDAEARKFTAKIMGEDEEPVQSPTHSKDSTSEDLSKDDLESKAEL